jgi:glycine/D-amino acid oxidase-like deaminating enzyme
MLKLPDKEESLLRPGEVKPAYPELREDIELDTVVIGGGITGITTAYLLKQAGQKVAVIEKATIGSGTTGHTTGKVTSQHNLIYAELSERLGAQKARIYAQANQTAVEQIDRIIKAERIDCGWERADNYVFTTQRRRVREFKQEAKIAAGLGLPASFETTSPLPFKITGAVKFTGQAHFSAQKFINHLAAKVNKGDCKVFENTRAIGINDDAPGIVKTINGRVVAKNIVVATNVPTFPLLARGLYCALEYPHTSYIVAGRPKIKLSGMYISPDKNHYSILPVGKGKEQIVLIGGQNHIRGHGRAAPNYQKLAGYAEVKFGVKSISYKWKAWDYMAYDNVPLIGKLYPWSKHLYVASAFKKWGLAHSMVAAMILRDSITGQPNEWADLYSPQRLSPITSIPHVIANSLG